MFRHLYCELPKLVWILRCSCWMLITLPESIKILFYLLTLLVDR
jgi:hypothetical protein